MRILIVDDHEPMRKIIKNILRQIGLEDMDEAIDGRDAVKKMKEKNFDIVLLDWNMPGMTGLDVLKIIKSDQNLKNIPVIMVTAESSKEKIIEAVNFGVTDYIVKPFTAEVLKKKIEEVSKKK
ncbi:MAG: response regulator [Candidatus Calescibacterium sp.]|nr:response regulator [Candidatus Calescibacterium sp.]MCX7734790.1 response regulator [bacterium]MDW8087381.1 response regulator [Candidatus Calescibacterium sp.]